MRRAAARPRMASPRPDPAKALVDALMSRPGMADAVRGDHLRNRQRLLGRTP